MGGGGEVGLPAAGPEDFCYWVSQPFRRKEKEKERKVGEGRRRAQLRRECRGLVVGEGGKVLVRPVSKCFMLEQVHDISRGGFRGQEVVDVTEKLDGQLMVGVVSSGGEVEMWSRGGRTQLGSSAMMCARRSEGRYEELIMEAEVLGCTVCFEYIGRQSRIKVRYEGESEVVMVAVREKMSGDTWWWEEMEGLGRRHGVRVVRRVCEGMRSLEEVREWVEAQEFMEGVMVRMSGGVVVKVKQCCWLGRRNVKRGWRRGVEMEDKLSKRIEGACDDRRVRLVVVGWPRDSPPVWLLSRIEGAAKVEACYEREGGKRGAVVVAFRGRGSAERAMACEWEFGLKWAYSNRCRSTKLLKVERWWRGGEKVE